MKELLHSKRFRKNLRKWLFMYVGVMGLFTTVITYSKYMSKFQSSDSASVARFDITVAPYECSSEITENCNYHNYRATSKIDYYFTVDTTAIDVDTNFYLTLYLNGDFSFVSKKVGDVNGELIELNPETNEEKRAIKLDLDTSTNNVYTIKDDAEINNIEGGKGTLKKFKITLKYNKKDYESYYTSSKSNNLLNASFSAVQKDVR